MSLIVYSYKKLPCARLALTGIVAFAFCLQVCALFCWKIGVSLAMKKNLSRRAQIKPCNIKTDFFSLTIRQEVFAHYLSKYRQERFPHSFWVECDDVPIRQPPNFLTSTHSAVDVSSQWVNFLREVFLLVGSRRFMRWSILAVRIFVCPSTLSSTHPSVLD